MANVPPPPPNDAPPLPPINGEEDGMDEQDGGDGAPLKRNKCKIAGMIAVAGLFVAIVGVVAETWIGKVQINQGKPQQVPVQPTIAPFLVTDSPTSTSNEQNPPIASTPPQTAISSTTANPYPTATIQPTKSATDLNACQIRIGCVGDQIGIPVTVNGPGFKKAIKDYMNNPSSSPYGSRINCWDVSQVTDVSYSFAYSSSTAHTMYDTKLDDPAFKSFNEPLDCWDTSNVITMRGMFWDADGFNQDLNSWNVSKVTDTSFMFYHAKSFNGNIKSWDVTQVLDTNHMFAYAGAFNQDISSWNVSSVTNMYNMCRGASSFNVNLCAWNDLVDAAAINVVNMFLWSGCEDESAPTSDNWCQVCAT